jgi:hypothetical protein
LSIVSHRRCHLNVAELVTLANVHELDIRWPAGGESYFIAGHVAGAMAHAPDLSAEEWTLLLTGMRLRSLRFPIWLCPSPRVIELAAAMPSLRTLSFASLDNEDPAIDLFAPLVRATQLSSLELHFGWCSPPSVLTSLRKLTSLRDLKLRGMLFDR